MNDKKKFRITKKVNKSSIVYKVFNEAGKEIGGRKSSSLREYVACLVFSDGEKESCMHKWFGRLDLIGKGDSKFMMQDNPNVYVAYLEGINPNNS